MHIFYINLWYYDNLVFPKIIFLRLSILLFSVFVWALAELTYPHPLQSAGTIVEASFCRNSINISRSVIWVWSCSTNWLFILSGLTIWPTAVSTWALSSSSLNLSMLSTFKFRRALSCSIKRIRRFVKRLLYFVLSTFGKIMSESFKICYMHTANAQKNTTPWSFTTCNTVFTKLLKNAFHLPGYIMLFFKSFC